MNSQSPSPRISTLLFDLGGVIMDLKRDNALQALRQLGMSDPDSIIGLYVQAGPFLQLEQGDITPAQFRDALRPAFPRPVSDAEIDDAFNSFLVGIPTRRLEALRELRRHFRVCLLSNTNRLMWDSEIARAFTAEGLTIDDYFDGIVTSFEARCVKPGAEIFRYAVSHLGIDPATTLFLDDSADNVAAARALGFNAEVVPPGTEFTMITDALLPS